MRWLIDIIIAAAKELIGFRDRGTVLGYDWILANLTQDGDWHTLGCSAIVPANTRAILVSVGCVHEMAGAGIYLRRYGDVNTSTNEAVRILADFEAHFNQVIVPLSTDLKFDYYLSDPPWERVNFTIKGWFL